MAIETPIQVPKEEDVRVIDLQLKEVVLGVTSLMALGGIAYTFYQKQKIKAETQKYEAMASAVGSIVKELSTFLAPTPQEGLLTPTNGSASATAAPKKQPTVKKSNGVKK